MNARDRDRLARLYACVSKWPWPNRTHTIGVKDLSEFYQRMENLQPLLMQSIMSIARPDVEDTEEDLAELEAALERMNQ